MAKKRQCEISPPLPNAQVVLLNRPKRHMYNLNRSKVNTGCVTSPPTHFLSIHCFITGIYVWGGCSCGFYESQLTLNFIKILWLCMLTWVLFMTSLKLLFYLPRISFLVLRRRSWYIQNSKLNYRSRIKTATA